MIPSPAVVFLQLGAIKLIITGSYFFRWFYGNGEHRLLSLRASLHLRTNLVLLWFLAKIKPKFPSGLSTTLVVFFPLLSVFTVDLVLGFAMAPLTHHKTVSLVYYSKVSLLEETLTSFPS